MKALEDQTVMRHGRPAADKIDSAILNAYYDKSWALVIGINDYGGRHQSLDNARKDAEDFAQMIKEKFSFDKDKVFTLLDRDATKENIEDLLDNRLPRDVGLNDRLLFFFSGHGIDRTTTVGTKIGYLIPQDAQEDNWRTYLNMEYLKQACFLIPAKHIFVILDCCFSGILALKFRSGTNVPSRIDDAILQKITKERAWQVLTAGESDKQVADSSLHPGHSPFAAALLQGLEGAADKDKNYIITATQLADFVRQRVFDETSHGALKGQYPYFGFFAETQGDFVFQLPEYGSKKKAQTDELIRGDRAERAKKIHAILNDLSSEDILPDRILRRALKIIYSKPEELSEDDRLYDGILEKLLLDGFEHKKVINEWNSLEFLDKPTRIPR